MVRRGWGGGGNEGDILSALSYVWGRSSRRARVGSDVWQLRIACYSDSAVGAQGVGMAVAWMLTNSKRDELLTKIYERYDGHALRMLMDALDGALTKKPCSIRSDFGQQKIARSFGFIQRPGDS